MSYTPTIPPEDPAAIPHYLTTELQALAQSLQQSQPYAYLQTLNVAPAKPREGLIAKADGTHWNPGSGAGVYCYIAGAWVFFGGGGGTGTVTHTSGALTAHAVIVGNGTADLKALAALGSSGNVLTSNGAGADPSFQAATGGITAGTGDVTFSGTGSVATTIALGNRHEWTATQNVAQVALTDASSITPNGALSNQFYLLTTSAVGGSRTINLPSSLNPGDFVNFEIKQPASGGPCVIVWAAGYTWGQGSQGSAPVMSTVAGASDFFSFTVRADGNLHGGMIGQGGSTGPGYAASSSTSLTPGTGAKALTTQLGLAYSAGGRARATSVSTGDYFEGPVASYTSAGVLTITADVFSGSTARTDWNINVAGNVGTASTVPGPTGPSGASSSAGPSGTAGRLTLTSGVPFPTTDVTGATTIYWCPYKGSQVQLWDGSNWTTYTSAQISIALGTLTASIGYDVFMYQNAGVPTLELLAWTNATTRATAVTYQDGRLCKSTDKTRLLLGSFYARTTTSCDDSGGGVSSQVGGHRDLWNIYNQELRFASVIDTTASWTYTAAAWRQTNGATGNKCEWFCGQPALLEAHVQIATSNGSANNFATGVGIDSTTTNSAQLIGGSAPAGVAAQCHAQYAGNLTVGYHAVNQLENGGSALGTQTWYGPVLTFFQGGMQTRMMN